MTKIRLSYDSCQSADEMLKVAMQNAIVEYLNQEPTWTLTRLEKEGYINRGPLNTALTENAPLAKVMNAFVMVCWYSADEDYGNSVLPILLQKEIDSQNALRGAEFSAFFKAKYGGDPGNLNGNEDEED